MVGVVLKRVLVITNQTPQTSLLLYELQQLLVQIKSCSEVNNKDSLQNVNQLSKYGLNLLHYTLFAIETQQTELRLTTLSAAAALNDVYYQLAPLAKAYNVNLNFEASPSLEPVYANRTTIMGSVYALVAGLITGINTKERTDITIAVQQTKPKQQRIGVYSNSIAVKPSTINKALGQLNSVKRMSMPSVTHRSGLGFAVSIELADRLNAKYHSFDHLSSKGIGFYLPESAQLSLI